MDLDSVLEGIGEGVGGSRREWFDTAGRDCGLPKSIK